MTTISNTHLDRDDRDRATASTYGASRLLAGTAAGPVSYAHHLALAGPLIHRSHSWLCQATRQVGLVGRGGAAFPVATKLAAVPAGSSTEVVVNGSESEPASFKDRVLMMRAPHRVIDGALVIAAALGRSGPTPRVTIAVHDQYASQALVSACAERADAAHVRVVTAPGGFVTGEARALLNALAGKPPVPDGRRVLPHVRGLGGRPTFISNAETFAQIGTLATLGPDGYAALGTPTEPGTSLVTMLGDVPHSGVAEVPHGTPIDRLTGALDGRPVLIGGYHGAWTRLRGLTIERADLARQHLSLGAGVLAVLPHDTCPLGEIARVAQWLAAQSARQCGPCLFGLSSLARDLGALHEGSRLDLGALQRRAGLIVGRGACANPDGAVRFMGSALDAFAEDVRAHHSGRGCGRPTLGILPTPEVAA